MDKQIKYLPILLVLEIEVIAVTPFGDIQRIKLLPVFRLGHINEISNVFNYKLAFIKVSSSDHSTALSSKVFHLQEKSYHSTHIFFLLVYQ